jgi:multicomponent Na+:H+ antiporter subunit G
MSAIDVLLTAIGGAFIIAGLFFMAGSVIGLLRFPDFYTRLHASRVGQGLGAPLILVGLAIASADSGVALRLLLLAALVTALGPTLSHLAANAAHAAGLNPIVGRYTAPRPGEKRTS